MNHVHHDLIVAWAWGAKIQCESNQLGAWVDDEHPRWYTNILYRLKPEPKPDVVLYGCVEMRKDIGVAARISHTNATISRMGTDNVMFIFDGETGKLKDAQVLASSAE